MKGKDRDAFVEAYDAYADKVYRFIYFKVGDALEAQDLTSSVFLKTWNYIRQNSVTDYKTLPALFYKIARNVVVDHYRKNSREETVALENSPEAEMIVDQGQDLLSKAALESDLELIKEKLSELKDEYREAIILRYVDELSVAEMATILDKSAGNVRILTFRALNALRELMGEDKSNG